MKLAEIEIYKTKEFRSKKRLFIDEEWYGSYQQEEYSGYHAFVDNSETDTYDTLMELFQKLESLVEDREKEKEREIENG